MITAIIFGYNTPNSRQGNYPYLKAHKEIVNIPFLSDGLRVVAEGRKLVLDLFQKIYKLFNNVTFPSRYKFTYV